MRRAGSAPDVDDDLAAREAVGVVESAIPGFRIQRCEPLKKVKSAVFALHSEGRRPLVAKRASAETIANEYRILRWIEEAPVPTVRPWAVVPGASGTAWLISDYVAGEPFDRRSANHRELVGTWLGDLHIWCAGTPPPDLPSRDLAYHRDVVARAQTTVEEAWRSGAALTETERAAARRLADASSRLLDLWDGVRIGLDPLPTTLVHSGIAGKNVRVVQDGGGHLVLAFDWEQGGWGCPAADLALVDLAAYRERWGRQGLSRADAERVGAIGSALWCLAGVPDERGNLLGRWPHRAAGKLEYYERCVTGALRILESRTGS